MAQRLRLLTFPKKIQDSVATGQFTVSHAEAIAIAPIDKQEELAREVAEEKLSVKETTEMAKDLLDLDKANREALENIASRLERLDDHINFLYSRVAQHVIYLELYNLHQHAWEMNDCKHNLQGFCHRFSWETRPSEPVEALRDVVKFNELADGDWHVEASALVCGHCDLHERRQPAAAPS